jgi:hypothetical protein
MIRLELRNLGQTYTKQQFRCDKSIISIKVGESGKAKDLSAPLRKWVKIQGSVNKREVIHLKSYNESFGFV